MLAIKLLRYSVATILFLLAGGLLIAAIVSTDQTVTLRLALGAGSLVSTLFAIGCIVNPELAKKVLVGGNIDKT